MLTCLQRMSGQDRCSCLIVFGFHAVQTSGLGSQVQGTLEDDVKRHRNRAATAVIFL